MKSPRRRGVLLVEDEGVEQARVGGREEDQEEWKVGGERGLRRG